MAVKRFCDFCGAEIEQSHPIFNIVHNTVSYRIECDVTKLVGDIYENVDLCKNCLKAGVGV